MQNIDSTDFVWGAAGIGRVINRNARVTHYLLDSGALPAKKVGGRWVASRCALLAFMSEPGVRAA